MPIRNQLSAVLRDRQGTKKLPYKTGKVFVTFCLQKVKSSFLFS
jgi:hypothetical protein